MRNLNAIDEFDVIDNDEENSANLAATFFETNAYYTIRSKIFRVLAAREARLKKGLFEQKGVAVIGAAGSGKSRMIAKIIAEYQQIAEARGGREFGFRIVSVIVPGKATVKETCSAILKKLGYPTEGVRTEDYLMGRLKTLLEHERVAAVYLDELQDAGRHTTQEAMSSFAKRFRNLMQDPPWPVCLILSATPEGREFINHDFTLTRRLRAVEILPMTPPADGPTLRAALEDLISAAELSHEGMIKIPDFMAILIHASAYRFGLAIELAIDAIGEATSNGDKVIDLDHFATAYHNRMNCDDELNPFVSDYWRGIDTTQAMERYIEDRKGAAKRECRK